MMAQIFLQIAGTALFAFLMLLLASLASASIDAWNTYWYDTLIGGAILASVLIFGLAMFCYGVLHIWGLA